MDGVDGARPLRSLTWAERDDAGRLWVSGVDRVEFLHGQSSNDVKALRAGQGHETTFLTGKGKMRGDGVLYALADRFLLVTAAGVAERVRRHLETYIVTEDVQIADASAEVHLFELFGDGAVAQAASLLGAVPEPAPALHQLATFAFCGGSVQISRERRGARLLADAAAAPALRATLRAWASPSEAAELEVARIEAGEPRFGIDTDDDTIPIEAGLLDAISTTKGCFTGNEVLARIKTYGHVNRELRGLCLDDAEVPAAGTRVRFDGREVGRVSSACFSPTVGRAIALAMIRREAAAAGTAVELEQDGRTRPARVVVTPFVTQQSVSGEQPR